MENKYLYGETKIKYGRRFELLVLGLKKGIVSKDGELDGKPIAEMTHEEIEKWIEKINNM